MIDFENHIWLASYPRSGNTFMRSILFKCFNLKTGSIYPRDLGHNKKLEDQVGHIEHNVNGFIDFQNQKLKIIKTHNFHNDNFKTIYILRDARPASLSMFKFYKKIIPLEDIILGKHRFGNWSNHILKWNPEKRKNLLFIKYEDLLIDFDNQLNRISSFIDQKILKNIKPNRNKISNLDGKWVNKLSNWEDEMPTKFIDLCNLTNKELLKKFYYI